MKESIQPVQSHCNFNKEYILTTAKQQYFSEIIDKNINNSQTLCAVVAKTHKTTLRNLPQSSFPQKSTMCFLASSMKK